MMLNKIKCTLLSLILNRLLRISCIILDEYIDEGNILKKEYDEGMLISKIITKNEWCKYYDPNDLGIAGKNGEFNMIHINGAQSYREIKKTLIHELTHIYQYLKNPEGYWIEYDKHEYDNNPLEVEAEYMAFLGDRLKITDLIKRDYHIMENRT